MSVLMAVVLGGLLILWLYLTLSGGKPDNHHARWPASTQHRPGSKGSRRTDKFPGVSIYTAPNCCHAAESIRKFRYLPEDAPALPLSSCTLKVCNCRYVHHADRRSGTWDRRKLIGKHRDYMLFFGNEDQREGRGRRARDWAPAYELNDTST